MTILIVDDNPSMRSVIRSLVEAPGDTIVECADGDEAVAAYGSLHPDWVLMDVAMKRMGGFDASAAILTADPQAKIVIVTQYDDAGCREKARRVGAGWYIAKERLHDLVPILGRN